MSINDALQILLALFTTETLMGILATLFGGWLVKHKTAWDNRLIPLLAFIGALITQIANFLAGQPPTPALIPGASDSTLGMAQAGYMQAGFFSGFPLKAVAAAVLQWLFTDKLYETQRKVVVGVIEANGHVPLSKSKVK